MADFTVNTNGTIADNAVTNAKLANMPEARVKMRAVGAGTGDPIDGTADELSTLLDTATDPFLRTSDYDPTPLLSASGIYDDSNIDAVNVRDALNELLTTDGNHDNSISQLITAVNGKAEASHTHAISDVTGLQTAIDGKAAASHTHSISDVTGLQTAIDGKAASAHTHAISDVTGLQTALDGKASSAIGTVVQLPTYTAGSQANSTTSLSTPTDTALALAVGVWDVYYAITYNAAVTTTGAHFTLGASGSLAASNIIGACLYTTGTGDADNSIIAAFDGGNPVASSRVTSGNGAIIMATLVVTTAGDVVVRFRSEVGASAITITNVMGFAVRKG